MSENRSHAVQMFLSLVVAAIIVAIAIALTTAQIPLDRLPPEQKEELRDDAEDRRDDMQDAPEDARDEVEDEDNGGPGS